MAAQAEAPAPVSSTAQAGCSVSVIISERFLFAKLV
jgi:hypothetical protein